jgi:hypothetical protein
MAPLLFNVKTFIDVTCVSFRESVFEYDNLNDIDIIKTVFINKPDTRILTGYEPKQRPILNRRYTKIPWPTTRRLIRLLLSQS